MNMPDPQVMTNAWIAQLNDPNQWKTWSDMVPQAPENPLAAILQDAGANIKPEALEELKNDYMRKLGSSGGAAFWKKYTIRKWSTNDFMIVDRMTGRDTGRTISGLHIPERRQDGTQI